MSRAVGTLLKVCPSKPEAARVFTVTPLMELEQARWSLGCMEKAPTPANCHQIFPCQKSALTHGTKIRRVLDLAGEQRQFNRAALAGAIHGKKHGSWDFFW